MYQFVTPCRLHLFGNIWIYWINNLNCGKQLAQTNKHYSHFTAQSTRSMRSPQHAAHLSTTSLPNLLHSSRPCWLTKFTLTLSHVYNEIPHGVMSGGDIINPSGCPGICHINEVKSMPWGAVREQHLITITEHRDWETKSRGHMTRRGNKVMWWGVCLQAVRILRKMLERWKYALILITIETALGFYS